MWQKHTPFRHRHLHSPNNNIRVETFVGRSNMQVAERTVRFAVENVRMDGVDGGGSGGGNGGSTANDPLATVSSEGGGGGASGGGATTIPAVSTVYVTIPQAGTIVSGTSKSIQSVIQQPTQPSVIQSTALQTVQISKGNVILLKQPSQPANSVIQSASGGGLQTVQVLEAGEDQESSRKRQILARRPSYRKILNELGGGEISDKGDAGSSDSSQDEPTATVTIGGQQYQTAVLPASGLQLAGQGSDGLQTLAMTNAATAGGAIVHYAQGSDPQFIVPVAAGDLSGLKIATSSSQGVVLATTASTGVHGSSDQMAEEASRKREIRLMKNREAARECRAKKKEYIKCLENRVAVLENQNKALIEELKTLKALYCQNS
ncbi:cyclic AMP-dependent transcription factor ATF-1-like isoform X2 [Portunus trituberculatus]|uniref:cyclic AMP-dependent transcription factor ATF-1-like isoform X2 n=1 Tax=Portunus trituberculatus TaxID=210409 RepID=UPI001E1CED09|nr:cyclic AMP-dependent transcription factor ATF-1-like isoform X2 [Portunus trituberculatus]